jgi:uncharacterized protein (DUF2147 family)
MKKVFLFFAFLLFTVFLVAAQADRVLGFWLTEEKDAQVEITKRSNGKYYGTIIWLDEPFEDDGSPKVDDENPDTKLQNRPILGLQLLKDFVFDREDEEWEDGTIYDPDSGNTYDCYMWFEDEPNVLYIKGYVLGMKFIGRRTHWVKESTKRQ